MKIVANPMIVAAALGLLGPAALDLDEDETMAGHVVLDGDPVQADDRRGLEDLLDDEDQLASEAAAWAEE